MDRSNIADDEIRIVMCRAAEVREKLDKLATLGTPEAIALELEAQGITAQRKDAYSCAIAKYLDNPEGTRYATGSVAVTASYVMVHWGTEGGAADHISTPRAVSDFIQFFDAGHYPALIAPPQPRDAA